MTELVDHIRQTGWMAMRFDTEAGGMAWLKANNLLDADGLPVPHIDVAILGPVATTKAVYDGEGNEVTPAVYDARFHVNAYLHPDRRNTAAFNALADYVAANGYDLPDPNSGERGVRIDAFGGVLLDQRTFTSPELVVSA